MPRCKFDSSVRSRTLKCYKTCANVYPDSVFAVEPVRPGLLVIPNMRFIMRRTSRIVSGMCGGLAAMLLGLAATTMPSVATGAENPKVNVDFFRPSVHPGDFLNIRTSAMPDPFRVGGGFYLTYSNDPLTIYDRNGDRVLNAVTDQLVGDAFASISLWSFLDIGVDVPVVFMGKGNPPSAATGLERVDGAALGDVRLDMKGVILPSAKYGIGLALAEDVTFPTATAGNYAGDNGVTLTTRLVLDYMVRGWQFVANVGYRARFYETVFFRYQPGDIPGNSADPELLISAGLALPILCGKLDLLGTAEARTRAADPFADEFDTAVDIMGGARLRLGNFNLVAAGGGGVTRAYGSPEYRLTASVAYVPDVDKNCRVDTDGDGVLDDEDKCPTIPGPAVTWGCPDDDGDLVVGDEDFCPDKAGPASLHGCPDTDGDGIADINDLCPTVPGMAEFQGCPDTDKDGVSDLKDRCPKDRGPKELDGCPDRDGDGLVDIDDQCPEVPGPKENAGCPEGATKAVEMFKVRDKIFFVSGKSIIKRESFPMLNDLAKSFNDHPELLKVRVEGHTDSLGNRAMNQKLSQNRAEAVRKYLIKQGVAAERLVAEGFADSKPIASNDTVKGRAINRRVEFTILEQR